MDTEFPSFLRSTPRGAPEEHLYQDLKFNLNHLKILQLGLTLMDENEHVGLSWVFTFFDFDEQTDFSSPTSIQYLKNNKGTMPKSMMEFAIVTQRHLGTVNDLKHMIHNCERLMNGELGLKRLAELLNVNDTIFNGGSDSLLIALVYAKIYEEDAQVFVGDY
ncbi:putative CCR4-associated factor 1 homolog 8 [Cucumis melo]|uniref:CCR4-associated factor 1 homolog 8 n=1 Tax=Cucumis melo TaxID=3656 RepID=A0A1S3BLG3_CUCME|nr:putative CCR4-associated factor 1 homolog 8 [Cucumis melo]